MQFPDIDPFVPYLHWGNFGIRWYALAYVAGILLGWWWAARLLTKETLWGPKGPPLNKLQLDDLILWITIGIIGGGRIGYILFYQPTMIWQSPLDMLKLWEGGMSFHGGLIGVALAIVLFARRNKIALLSIGDLVAPAAPIGLFFGRIANFINGELWGRPTDAPWGIRFCNATIEATYGHCPAGMVPRHPSQLYEAGLEGVVLFLVLYWATFVRKLLPQQGMVTGIFLAGYGVCRFLLENVREPDQHMPDFLRGHVTMGMLLSIPMIAVGVWLIWRARRVEAPAAA